MIKPIKTIKTHDHEFLETIGEYPMLVEVHPDQSTIKPHEKFLTFVNGNWNVLRMTKDRGTRLCGRFTSLHKAVFRARLNF